MNKRVLRDRSTLRPPPDEPPIKKIPPKPKIIKGPFPFEDLPPEYHNIVLEKLPVTDFQTFNLGSKFSARICEEFENKDGPFPLEELPQDFYSSVVEKLPFKDLTMFNLGSKLTVKMCEQLKEIKAPVKKVYIVEGVESFKTPQKKARLSQVPKNVRLDTKTLEIDQMDLNAIEKYKISADKVEFYGQTGIDADFVEKVLNLTRPKEVYFNSTSPDVLKLKELEKMEDVTFIPWNNFNDRELLAINLESLTIGLRPEHTPTNVTSQGILQLLQEWKVGLRKIKKIVIMFAHLELGLIHREFSGHTKFPSNRMILCKGDGESDCFVDSWGYWLKIVEQECLGLGTSCRNRYNLATCCRRWSVFRRSPPL